ncbi:hypothetical protein [Thiothrix litoralis]|uniref:hypothetical protein n=1 Tax=Thiothrix litoralis TaxID=2891210 RepID=UPI003C7114BA
MGKSRVIPPREQTRAEEVANSVSHGIALAAALVGTPFLVLQAICYRPSATRQRGSLWGSAFLPRRPCCFIS